MVKTRAEVKIKISELIENKKEKFTTQEILEDVKPIAKNIFLTPNRLSKYIQGTGKVDYNKKAKCWEVKTRPFEKCLEKTKKNTTSI